MFCAPTATFDPWRLRRRRKINVRRADDDFVARVAGDQGQNSRKNARVCSGFLYIFQLAAISFFLDI